MTRSIDDGSTPDWVATVSVRTAGSASVCPDSMVTNEGLPYGLANARAG